MGFVLARRVQQYLTSRRNRCFCNMPKHNTSPIIVICVPERVHRLRDSVSAWHAGVSKSQSKIKIAQTHFDQQINTITSNSNHMKFSRVGLSLCKRKMTANIGWHSFRHLAPDTVTTEHIVARVCCFYNKTNNILIMNNIHVPGLERIRNLKTQTHNNVINCKLSNYSPINSCIMARNRLSSHRC